MIISLDGMGGDTAPEVVVSSAHISSLRHKDVKFIIFGDGERISKLVKQYDGLSSVVEVRHTTDDVLNEDNVRFALRNRRNSSMWRAIESVKSGESDGIVSGGNTGVFVSMALLILRPLDCIDRSAIASFVPLEHKSFVMLDLGANISCTPRNLVQFAIMGSIFYKLFVDKEKPKVGLLNVGAEELKGTDALRGAAEVLKSADFPMDFCGFIEGDEILTGEMDVIVSDGYAGNIALKSTEGTAKYIISLLKQAFKSSLMSKIAYLLAKSALKRKLGFVNPSRYNGGVLIGLNGLCVKSHGSSNDFSYANAIDVAVNLARQKMVSKLQDEVGSVYFPDFGDKGLVGSAKN